MLPNIYSLYRCLTLTLASTILFSNNISYFTNYKSLICLYIALLTGFTLYSYFYIILKAANNLLH